MKIAQAYFPASYFEYLEKSAPLPPPTKDLPEIHIWPKDVEKGNLLLAEPRAHFMAAIHSRAEEQFQQKIRLFAMQEIE